MLRTLLVSILISFSAWAIPDFHMHKCMLFTSVAAIGDGVASTDFRSELELCLKHTGSIHKVCSDKKYGLCKNRKDVHDIAPSQSKMLNQHLATMLLGYIKEYGKRIVKSSKVAHYNKDFNYCFKQQETNLISKVGNSYVKLLSNYLRNGKALSHEQSMKLTALLDKIFAGVIKASNKCFKQTGVDDSVGSFMLCERLSSIKTYSHSLQKYCDTGKRVLENRASLNNDSINKCVKAMSLSVAVDSIRKFKHSKGISYKIAKYCVSLQDPVKVCSVIKTKTCKKSKGVVSQLFSKENITTAEFVSMLKFITPKKLKVISDLRNVSNSLITKKIESIKKKNYKNREQYCQNEITQITNKSFHLFLIEKLKELYNGINDKVIACLEEFSQSSRMQNCKADGDFNQVANKVKSHQVELTQMLSQFINICVEQGNKDHRYYSVPMCKTYAQFIQPTAKFTNSKVQNVCGK